MKAFKKWFKGDSPSKYLLELHLVLLLGIGLAIKFENYENMMVNFILSGWIFGLIIWTLIRVIESILREAMRKQKKLAKKSQNKEI